MALTLNYSATQRRQLVALPDNAVHDFNPGISRFSTSHGCAEGTVASAKTANNKSFTSLETFHGVFPTGVKVSANRLT